MLTPRPRHAQAPFGAGWNAIIALGGIAAGIGLLAKGQIFGLVALSLAALIGWEGYLKYKTGNWP